MNALTERLMILYGQPNTPNPTAFLAIYNEAFHGVPKDVLADAGDCIARTRKVSSWPTLAECLDAVETAKSLVKVKGAGLKPIESWEQWFGALQAQCANAETQADIDQAVAKVEPYCKAQWCFPGRADELRGIGARRLASLKGKPVIRDPSTGEAA